MLILVNYFREKINERTNYEVRDEHDINNDSNKDKYVFR